ncbi:AIPR family protein [Aeromonas sp. 603359]|uniref:AIPR family protein n=1 Tax=Aeromonas sp. 603359 TaxID=2712046 RepID=UPI003B9FCCFC
MDKITKSLLDSFVEQFEISKLSESLQFEHFTNYSVATKSYRNSFDLDDIHTGSGGDCAIDGLIIIVNGRLILDDDELTDIVTTSGFLDADIIFIQSKTSSSFDGSQIGNFIHGIKDFLSDNPRLVQNEKIIKIKSIWEKMLSMSSYMINRRPACKIYYVCTGKWQNDQNLNAVITSGVEELEHLSLFESIDFDPLGASEIQRLYHETKNKLTATINFQNRITLPDIEGISEAYLGVIPYNEYLKLIQDDQKTIHSIFDDNVRDFQGENAVNRNIKRTLEDGKFDLFCVLNNGVTIVASSITPAGNRFTIRDYQIVNGCQTSHVLHDCQNIHGIENVFIPTKIIVTANDDIKTSITLATNSQTEVKAEQLEALSSFQRKLELYFKAEKNNITLYYERRSQQYNSDAGIKRTQIISIPIQIKAFASMFLDSPHLVSGYYGTIVNRFSGKIFSENHMLSLYYVSALAFYKIEQFFRSGEIDVKYKKIRFHLLMLIRLISLGDKMEPFNSKSLDKKCETLKNTLLKETESLRLFEKAVSIYENSSIDKDKRQYKSESDTELFISAYRQQYQKTELPQK